MTTLTIGETIHRQPTTGMIHADANCSVARRSRCTTERQIVSQVILDAVTGNHPYARLCRKCYPAPAEPAAHVPGAEHHPAGQQASHPYSQCESRGCYDSFAPAGARAVAAVEREVTRILGSDPEQTRFGALLRWSNALAAVIADDVAAGRTPHAGTVDEYRAVSQLTDAERVIVDGKIDGILAWPL